MAWSIASQAVRAWIADYAPSMGAAIAFYTLFSVAPLVLIVMSVAGLMFNASTAQTQIISQINGLIGSSGAHAVQDLLAHIGSPRQSKIAAATGTVALAIGATSVFAELQSALDRIWRVPAANTGLGLWQMVKTRLLSFGMILGLGFLSLVSLLVSAALTAMGTWWGPVFGVWPLTLKALNLVVSFVVVTLLFAIIYKWLPRARIGWRDVWIGALVTSALFAIGKELIGLYLGTSGVSSAFGAAGSFAVMLLWVYYSAQIFLLGAEFTWVFAHQAGSRRDQALPASGQPENFSPLRCESR